MRCTQTIIELDAYLTGELDPETAVEIGGHLKECAACAAERQMLERERALYLDHASTATVSTDAWSHVQERLTATHLNRARFRLGRWPVWAMAASLLLVLGLSLYLFNRRGPVQPESASLNGRSAEVRFHIDRAVKDFEQALALLDTAYREKKPALGPPLVAELDRNLKLIDAAIAECQRALQTHPDDRQAVEFLLIAYRKKIAVLEQIMED
jgi:tetratricopeptide (TPR) repeat protein